tara:strand:- start:930 stop:1424 length:495 start_codon:yes stop_codon:yes gene_type:complete
MRKQNVPTAKSGKAWTAADEETIAVMVDAGFTEAEIGEAIGRSEKSIQVRKVRIRARAGKIRAYNKATDVAINKAIGMTEEELEFIRKHEQQWADFREGHMGEGKTSGLLHAEQFMSDEDSEVSPENNKKTSPGYSTLRIPHTYFYTCVYVVALSLAFYLGSIY